ncbi:cell division protein FtsL [Anaeromyxobacter paludicola]|uniref:Cell division protein FtsL n=1 Tax=Anaeromyxobacter paludicola TaxID=2918171 RepID=A0ABN6NE36_9BACT|nr:cell division protein FtsL [Anaeromyxobacter paludicola]BDG10312.1 hypothetical protein AMPC_34250 [Anaeromyxobacter paludicola]
MSADPGVCGQGGRVVRCAAWVALFSAVALFRIWSHTQVITSGYELARLEGEHQRLEDEHGRLQMEVARLRAPGRLERFARAQLGMAPPAPGTVMAGTEVGRVVVAERAGGVAADKGTLSSRKQQGRERTGHPAPAEPAVFKVASAG